MTYFEEFAKETGVKIETDENGFYKGMCKALALATNEVILSDEHYEKEWNEQKEIIKERFYKTFPYMKK